MTPDELITRVHRQRAELAAQELAIDALMQALSPEQQRQWLAALQTLQAKRTQALQAAGVDELAIAQGNEAIGRRLLRLQASGTESSGGG